MVQHFKDCLYLSCESSLQFAFTLKIFAVSAANVIAIPCNSAVF